MAQKATEKAEPEINWDELRPQLVKMALELGPLVVFFIASALVGRSAKLEGVRQKRGKWLTLLVIIALVIVSISGFLKIRGVPSTLSPEIAPDTVAGE